CGRPGGQTAACECRQGNGQAEFAKFHDVLLPFLSAWGWPATLDAGGDCKRCASFWQQQKSEEMRGFSCGTGTGGGGFSVLKATFTRQGCCICNSAPASPSRCSICSSITPFAAS